MNILVINAGSSSIKYQLIDTQNEGLIAKGMVERIGIEGANLLHKPQGMEPVLIIKPMYDHVEAMQNVLEALIDPTYGVVRSLSEIHAVGHRVVHGGEKFRTSAMIDDDVIKAIEENVDLAPLHNPANLMGILACRDVMPNTPMVAVFDTAFHQSMPPYAFLYALPYDYYKRLRVRRYGFHGTSHAFVCQEAAKYLGRPLDELRIITCHLGNGSSVAAVKYGKSVDTSMGFTPLEGVIMGTRSGDLDPAILEYVMKKDGIKIEEMMSILNKKSGMVGISGISSDMRDTTTAALEGNKQAQLTIDMVTYRVKKYIGAYAAAMGGLDCVVFTAGIGENMPHIREGAINDLAFLGIQYDQSLNIRKTCIHEITKPDSPVKVLVIPTNEELVIARDTERLMREKSC